MSTERNTRDNLPTVCYDEENKKSAQSPKTDKFHSSAASESRRLSDIKPATCAQLCRDEEENDAREALTPDFSPTYVQISFDDIELGECCGEGSFGTVYTAKWLSQGGKDVAVKTLNRMDEEVRILSTLSHRNIVQFYGACCEKPNYCLVTEYAPYGSLYCFLASEESENLEFAQMLSWAGDVALGMNYLHEEAPIQVVHRDLKSKNVLICQDFSLKICDFGASRVFAETTVMTITGTYPWMAPELIQGLPTSEMCDVYSFGVVLWELLTKEVPFKGLQGFQVAWNVVERKERPLIPTSCPKRLSNLMQQCWQADAADRPPFCDIIVELNEMLTDGELEKQTDSFVHTKPDWIVEVKSKLKDIRHQESELVAESGHAKQREDIMKQWAERLENELKLKSLFNFQFSATQQSFNCEFSGTSSSASTSNVRDKINRMMFNSGLHRHSMEEKLGKRMDGFSPSNGTSPLFGMPLSRQGSTSSMESSRSMSRHSDMAYDMAKVGIDNSPVSFMDSTNDGFAFQKSREPSQLPGISRMKLQKQMSASSEEFQYEGMKMSRDNTLANGSNGGEVKQVNEWEKASAKSSVNKMNESLEMKTGNFSENPKFGSTVAYDAMTIPTVDVLEKALKDMDIDKCSLSNTSEFSKLLHEKLEQILNRQKSSSSPLEEIENDITPQNSIVPCKSQRSQRSPPIIKNMPTFSSAQKPPIKFSPTKSIDADELFNTVRHRPRKQITKNALTQTMHAPESIKMKDSSTQTSTNGSRVTGNDINGKKKIINYLHHVPCMENICTDATESNGKDKITSNPPVLPKYGQGIGNSSNAYVNANDEVIGQVHDNSVNRRKGNTVISLDTESFRKTSLPSRLSPPKSLLLDQCNSPEPSLPERPRVPRHTATAARQVYSSTRASSISDGQNSSIYETNDFTYIIRPNRRHR